MAEYEVTGVRYQMGDGLTMEERTRMAEAFIRSLEVGTPVMLEAEPDNPKDCEAIAVYADVGRVGYVKRECCAEVRSLLDADGQGDAVVSGNDGHVTFFVEITGAPEQSVPLSTRERKLPECPLPQGLALAVSDKEHMLKVIATRLIKTDVTTDTAEAFAAKAEHYMPFSRLSLCYEDDYWRDHVLKLLRKACRLKLPLHLKDRLEAMYGELQATIGDFHSIHKQWSQKVFDQQLEKLKKQAEGEDGLFARYEQYVQDASKVQPDIISRLMGWFAGMPHVELCNYSDHARLAQRLNYMRVSRQELYEVYAAVLLLEKYGKTVSDKDIKLPKELDTDEARKYFAKAMEKQYLEAVDGGKYRWIGTDNKGKTAELAYFLGRVYNYVNTETGNDGENFPEESLNKLFGAKRLYSSLTQVYDAQKPQRWRSQIDEMFD